MVEEPQGALAWLHKPRTVRRMEERLERIDRGLWNGAEIGKFVLLAISMTEIQFFPASSKHDRNSTFIL